MGDAIKNLYNQLILRDLLSFITPGAIIIWATCYLFFTDLLKQPIHWLLYIPIFGIIYTTGFAAQCLGELLGMRLKREYRSTWRQRLVYLNPFHWDDNNDNSKIWWEEGNARDNLFFNSEKSNDSIKQGRERLVVLKQMCGNNMIALIITFILLIMYIFNASNWFLLIVAIPLFVALFWGQRVHLLKQWSREEIVKDLNKESK